MVRNRGLEKMEIEKNSNEYLVYEHAACSQSSD